MEWLTSQRGILVSNDVNWTTISINGALMPRVSHIEKWVCREASVCTSTLFNQNTFSQGQRCHFGELVFQIQNTFNGIWLRNSKTQPEEQDDKSANCALCLHDMTCGLTELLNDLNNHLQPSLVDRKWSINKAKALFVSTDVFRNWCWWVIWDKDHLGQLMWHFFCHLLSVLRQPTPGLYCYPIQHVKNTELILSLAFCFCALPPLVTSACLYQLC